MEQFPGTSSKPEKEPIRMLTSEQVLDALSQYAEGFTLGRELSDEQGVYLREVEVQGEKEGEVAEYQYMRKGNHSNQNASAETIISVIHYEYGIPVGGDRVAVLDEETNEWRKL